jgi:hypothetical protein
MVVAILTNTFDTCCISACKTPQPPPHPLNILKPLKEGERKKRTGVSFELDV